MKQEMINYCKFYDGSNNAPDKFPDIVFWENEKKWYAEASAFYDDYSTNTPFINECMLVYQDYYHQYDGRIDDEVPDTLKACLFHAYLHKNEAPTFAEFVGVYNRWKNGEL